MLTDLWLTITGRVARAPRPAHLTVTLPDEDSADTIVAEIRSPPEFEAGPIAGFACIITYSDARGRSSERRVTCQRLDRAASQIYLYAYCHERAAVRQFRLDRIIAVIDLHTGEVEDEPARFFERFTVDREQSTKLGWGLSVRKRADLVAGLNALVFMARCDREWHPLEREALEAFIASYWLRAELPGEPPLDEIMAHADRLAPDAETFYVSLMRCGDNPVLARMIRRHIQAVVEADGRIAAEEFHWGSTVDDFFRTLNN